MSEGQQLMGAQARLRAGRRRAKRSPVEIAEARKTEAELWTCLKASLVATLEPHREARLTAAVRTVIAARCKALFAAVGVTQKEALALMRAHGFVIKAEMGFRDE